ncbi:DinB family protein [uncultured Croceitalea sp.]|uniref:DinB family protein n=1 Tax=uncultured Croceitalea sp. TaxID=1798908 RepID=UPI003305DE7D
MNTLLKHIIQQLLEIQNGKLWIGSSYHSKLKDLDEDLVFVRPIKNLHSIAEIISHLTLWRTEAILKIRTGEGSKTDDCEENWLPNERLKTKGWTQIKSEYDNSLSELIALLKDKDDGFLDTYYYDTDFKGQYTYSFLMNGMLHHDLYHLGQLGIIIKFLTDKA